MSRTYEQYREDITMTEEDWVQYQKEYVDYVESIQELPEEIDNKENQ